MKTIIATVALFIASTESAVKRLQGNLRSSAVASDVTTEVAENCKRFVLSFYQPSIETQWNQVCWGESAGCSKYGSGWVDYGGWEGWGSGGCAFGRKWCKKLGQEEIIRVDNTKCAECNEGYILRNSHCDVDACNFADCSGHGKCADRPDSESTWTKDDCRDSVYRWHSTSFMSCHNYKGHRDWCQAYRFSERDEKRRNALEACCYCGGGITMPKEAGAHTCNCDKGWEGAACQIQSSSPSNRVSCNSPATCNDAEYVTITQATRLQWVTYQKLGYVGKGDLNIDFGPRYSALSGENYPYQRLKSVEIHASVKKIDSKGDIPLSGTGAARDSNTGTISGFRNLEEVIFAKRSSKLIIGQDAFRNNPKLKTIVIPEGVTEIGRRAFKDCKSLETVHLPESLLTIDEGAFEGCTSLNNVRIPSAVRRINFNAFRDTKSMTSISYANLYGGITLGGGDLTFAGSACLKINSCIPTSKFK